MMLQSKAPKAMFKKRLLKLADIIENNKPLTWHDKPVKFNMSTWGRERSCGTAACIAGHAAILSGQPFDLDKWEGRPDSACGVGANWLGITDQAESLRLFIPTNYGFRGDLKHITRRRAAAVLRHYAETGKIDWNIKLPPVAALARAGATP